MKKHEKYIKYTYKAARLLGWLGLVVAIIALVGVLYNVSVLSGQEFLPAAIVFASLLPFIVIIIFSVALIIIAFRIKKSQTDSEKVLKELIALLVIGIISLFFRGGIFALVLAGYAGLTIYYTNKFVKQNSIDLQKKTESETE
jgi:cbb3-type cytochrome oxidase subunit 3